MKYKNHTFENSTEVIDGNEYESCEFRNCRIVYRGGELPLMRYCNFIAPQFFMEDAAQRTMLLLQNVYHAGDWGMRIIEDTFNLIRKHSTAGEHSRGHSRGTLH